MTMTPYEEAADAIVRAHRDRVPFDASTGRLAIADLKEAQAIQDAYVARLIDRFGPPVGYKIGLTSRTMQEMCGIDHPVPGAVLARRVHASGSRLSMADHAHPGIEFEIAVRIGRDLPPSAAPFDIETIGAAVDSVCAAFEIIDDRHADYSRLDIRALVADNSWNGAVVLGEFRTSWPDLTGVRGVIERDGTVIDEGDGRSVLGHPLAPVAWLADHLAGRGTALRAGQIVLTGSLARTRFVAAGERYRLSVEGIGAVEVTFVP